MPLVETLIAEEPLAEPLMAQREADVYTQEGLPRLSRTVDHLSPSVLERIHTRFSIASLFQCYTKHPELRSALYRIQGVNDRAKNITLYVSQQLHRLHPDSRCPFRLSPEAFSLPSELGKNVNGYGSALVSFYKTAQELIASHPDHPLVSALNHHKPDWLLSMSKNEAQETPHLFLRPDFILTDDHPVVTEIETSPFGLGLSHFLAESYTDTGADVLPSKILEVLVSKLGERFQFLLTDYTRQYDGQFQYLAEQLRKYGIDATVTYPDTMTDAPIYRCFYLHQAAKDERLREILETRNVYPRPHPMLEEKALMALLWDDSLVPLLQEKLGMEKFTTLRSICPRMYVLSNTPPASLGIQQWKDLAAMSRTQRRFVLKTSGFSSDSSWAKGVTFLEKTSRPQCEELLQKVQDDENNLYVLQEFKKGKVFSQQYFDFASEDMKTMSGRVRFTPYFDTRDGSVVTAKTTMCENTDYIHAMIDSINSPIKYV